MNKYIGELIAFAGSYYIVLNYEEDTKLYLIYYVRAKQYGKIFEDNLLEDVKFNKRNEFYE